MNRWAANNPELFEELGGNEGMAEHFRGAADHARKEAREDPDPLRERIDAAVACGDLALARSLIELRESNR